jgi:hypothetical protein
MQETLGSISTATTTIKKKTRCSHFTAQNPPLASHFPLSIKNVLPLLPSPLPSGLSQWAPYCSSNPPTQCSCLSTVFSVFLLSASSATSFKSLLKCHFLSHSDFHSHPTPTLSPSWLYFSPTHSIHNLLMQ